MIFHCWTLWDFHIESHERNYDLLLHQTCDFRFSFFPSHDSTKINILSDFWIKSSINCSTDFDPSFTRQSTSKNYFRVDIQHHHHYKHFSTIRHEISRLLSLDVETRKLEERRTVASGKSSSNHASLVHQHESQQKNDVKWILNWQTLTALWRKEAENNFEELLSQRLNWINKFSFKWTEWNVSLSKGMEILREKQIRWFHDEA